MRLFGFEIGRAKAIPASLSPVDDNRGWLQLWSSGNGCDPGSWQADTEVRRDQVFAQTTVFACITLIASDIGKIALRIVQRYGRVWLEKTVAGYTEVLALPNHFQTRQQFIEHWIISKLSHGNTYVLLERDRSKRVVRMYILDPNRVTPLVAPDGSIYYQLQEDDLSGVHETLPAVPASEIIHDRMNCLYHPLVGLSPIFASGLVATTALRIQQDSSKFFQNMSRPGGILTAPTKIGDEAARRIKQYWETEFTGSKSGRVAVLGDSMTFTSMAQNAVDAELIAQLKTSAVEVCATFHVPPYMVGAAPEPTYSTTEAKQRYYDQCLHALLDASEACLDRGLGLGLVDGNVIRSDYDLDDLLRMDAKTMAEAEGTKVQRGISAPNESRQKFNLLPVEGGDSPYLQQQNFALSALAKRDASADPFGTAAPALPPPSQDQGTKAIDSVARLLDGVQRRMAGPSTEIDAAEFASGLTKLLELDTASYG